MLLAVQTGLRLSEMTSLQRQDVHLGTGAHVRCMGKGRKERCTPLTKQAVGAIKNWFKEPTTRGNGFLAMPAAVHSVRTLSRIFWANTACSLAVFVRAWQQSA